METCTRLDLLDELAARADAPWISLVLGDRRPVATRLAPDIIPIIYRHLQRLGKTRRLALVLYTTGGDTLVPLRLQRLLREYCSELSVYVPFRAHSAGTMICLGADNVYLSPLGELSPIDPTISSPFLPRENSKPGEISIEDVVGYLELARDRWAITDQGMLTCVFSKLVEALHPLPLGNVHRTYEGIRVLANELLALRNCSSQSLTDDERAALVDYLTSKMWFHNLPIARSHAQDIGMKFVLDADPEMDLLLTRIYDAYAEYLQLAAPFVPDDYLSEPGSIALRIQAALLESKTMSHVFLYDGRLESPQVPTPLPPGVQPSGSVVQWTRNRWSLVRDIEEPAG